MCAKKQALEALRSLSRADVEQRLVELDAERAALIRLRRSLAARDAARRRVASLAAIREETSQ